MPAGNPFGYLPPDVQLALLGGAAPGGLGLPAAGLGNLLALSLQGAAPAPAAFQRPAARQPAKPHVSQFDINQLRTFRQSAVRSGQQAFANELTKEIVRREQAERMGR